MICFSTIESLITFAHRLSFGICWMPLIKYLKNSFWEELNKFETFEITMTKSQLGPGTLPFLACLPFHFQLFIFNFTARKRLPRCFISHLRRAQLRNINVLLDLSFSDCHIADNYTKTMAIWNTWYKMLQAKFQSFHCLR